MAAFRMKVTTATMPHTSEFFALAKAVEHFYYALLFSGLATYARNPEPWRSWVAQGFSAAIRQPPPDTAPGDALAMSVRSEGKVIELTASSSSDEVLASLAKLLETVDAQRQINAGDQATPSEALRSQLFEPVSQALTASGVDSRTARAITATLTAGVRALTYRMVSSMEVSTGAGVR